MEIAQNRPFTPLFFVILNNEDSARLLIGKSGDVNVKTKISRMLSQLYRKKILVFLFALRNGRQF